MPFRKPKLPIEMAYQSHEEATALTEGSPTCSSEDITKRAAVMFELKERIHKRAIENIHRAQETYKHYYDKKHSDSKVN